MVSENPSFSLDTLAERVSAAVNLGLSIMEWTLDQDNLSSNPLLIKMVKRDFLLCNYYGISIPS